MKSCFKNSVACVVCITTISQKIKSLKEGMKKNSYQSINYCIILFENNIWMHVEMDS